MSALTIEQTRVTDLGAMMRRLEVALRDREWEGCPVGREVASSTPHGLAFYGAVLDITHELSSSRGAR